MNRFALAVLALLIGQSLFLGAMVLFLMTFLVNTIAEVMRQRLRERYKTVE